jgi:predicted ATP-dependent endonuclease of OLD family
VSIRKLQSVNESELDKQERTALALLRLAHVATEEFTEDSYEPRKAALEAAANRLSDEVFEYWSQNRELEVELDIEFRHDDPNNPEPFLQVRIRNRRHRVSLNFSERSAGFVWFFSFLAAFSEFRDAEEPIVLLLDEPGLGLHAAAQDDLLRFIDEKLAPMHQVIYSTHSPFMVQPAKLHRARTVEDVDDEGTKVRDDVMTTSKDTVFPLQAALGYELAQTLFLGPDNLVVEGPADLIYLQVISEYARSKGLSHLDDRWVIVPAGGLDKIPTFISLIGAQLNVVALVDIAGAGPQRIADLVQRGVIEQKRIVPVTEFTGTGESDLEDLFDETFYLQLLRASGTATVKKADLKGGDRIVRRAEEATGASFSHYRPARHFLQHQDELLPKISEEALARFVTLFERVNKLLS